MAAIQNRNGSYRIFFEYQRKQRVFTIGRVSEAEAKAKADQVDYLLMRLSQGLLSLQPGVDIMTFVRHDGLMPAAHDMPAVRGEPTLADLRFEPSRGALRRCWSDVANALPSLQMR